MCLGGASDRLCTFLHMGDTTGIKKARTTTGTPSAAGAVVSAAGSCREPLPWPGARAQVPYGRVPTGSETSPARRPAVPHLRWG
jgi:hypothetical protein